MPEFPQRETDVVMLARRIVSGFRDNPTVFPTPVVDPDQLEALCEEFIQAIRKADSARARAKEATKHKRGVLDELISSIRDSLHYAVSATSSDDRKLALIGWGARRPARPQNPPGQVDDLEIAREDAGRIKLRWAPPPKETGTGKVIHYLVQRTQRGKDDWRHVGSALVEQIWLDSQERGVEWQYRVIAENKEGRGTESNVVTAVL